MRNKHELYATQQHDMISNIVGVLELDEESSITLWHLDQDSVKQQRLMKLIPEIRKWFAFSGIEGVSEPHRVKRPWLSLIKRIVGREYVIAAVDYRLRSEDPVIRTKRYTFHKRT